MLESMKKAFRKPGADTPASDASGAGSEVDDLEVLRIPVDQVAPWPNLNPRRRFIEADIEEIAASIESDGQIEPCVVTPASSQGGPEGLYWLAVGEKRLRACVTKSLPVLCLVRELTYARALRMAGFENLHRGGLSAIEEALWLQKMLDEIPGLTQAQLAVETHQEPSTIANKLRLLKLPARIQELIEDEKIAATNARDFLLPWCDEEEELQAKLFDTAAQQIEFGASMGVSMSKAWVRDMAKGVAEAVKPEPEPEPVKKSEPKKAETKAATKPAPKTSTPTKSTPEPAKAEKPAAEEAKPAKAAEPETESPDEPTAERQAAAEASAADPEPEGEALDEEDSDATPEDRAWEHGPFAAAAAALDGSKAHHIRFIVQRDAGGGDGYQVSITPQNQSGMKAGLAEVAEGLAEALDGQVAVALDKVIESLK